jgi:Tfp pilus assembly protein PilX
MTTNFKVNAIGMHRERGTALFVAMILLIGVTLLSIASVHTGTMELRMAQNREDSSHTFQTALAAVDYVIEDSSNLPAVGPLLVPQAVALNDPLFQTTGSDTVTASAARLEDCALPPRARQATSLTAYSAFKYEVTAEVDKNDSGMGRSGVAQGYILLGPKC